MDSFPFPTLAADGRRGRRQRSPGRSPGGWTLLLLLLALVGGSAGEAAAQTRTITVSSPSVAEGDAAVEPGKPGEVELVFTATLSSASPEGKEFFRYADAGTGTATAGTDYLALVTGTAEDKDADYAVAGFAAGDTTTTITVTVNGDTLDEANETVVLTLSNPNGATLAATTATGTITDDDPTPAVTLALGSSSIAEGGATNSTTVTASLDARSGETTTVTIGAAAGTNAESSDFSLSADKTLTISAGQQSSTGTVTISAVDNALDEPNKSITVSGTASNLVGITQPPNVTLTITDDDPTPSLTISSPSVTEGDTGSVSLTYTVTLGAESGREVTVDYADAGTGTATSGTDYTAISSGTLTFAAGETGKEITVSVTGDTDSEADETVAVRLSGAVNATIATALGTGTIRDQDGPPTVSLALSATEIPESGANASSTVTASLNRASAVDTTITVSATAGTNADASNFSLTGSTLTIAAGDLTSTGSVTISAVDDADDEPNRTVVVSGQATNTDGVNGPASLTLTIVDDDGLPGLYLDSPSVTEGDSGSTTMTYTVTLSPATASVVTVNYADAGTGTAASGPDYTAIAAGTLTFAANETTRTIAVSVNGDTLDENDETVVVSLSNPSGASLGLATGTGTVRDDDSSSSLSIASETVTEGTGAATDLTFTVTLSAISARQVTVDYADAGTGTATSGQDYTAISSGTLTFAPGDISETVTVSVIGDTRDEDSETVAVTLSGVRGATIATATATGTITDDDAAPTLSIDSPAVAEGDSGTTNLVFTVSLSAVSGKETSAEYADAGTGTATSGTDYTAVSGGAVVIAAGQSSGTITVVVTGDRTDESNETVDLRLSSPRNATIAAADGTGTIRDDDGPPRVTLLLSPYSVGENGGTSTVTAGLTHASTEATTVTVSFAAGTNTQASHYTTTGSTLTIAAGATTSTGTVRIQGVNDTADNSNRSVIVSGTASNSRGATNPADVTLTIVDDDGDPKLTIDSPRVVEGDSGGTNLNFSVRLSPASTNIVSVSFSETGGGTATRGTDFDRLTPGSTTFQPGQTGPKGITVRVRGDTVQEADETVILELRFPQGGATIENGRGVGTIVDDEDSPTISIDSPTVTEGDSGTTNLDFTVSLSGRSPNTIHLDFNVGTGTATKEAIQGLRSNTDYRLVDGSLTFAPGETTKTVRTTVFGDTKDEPDETVVVTLSGVIGGGIITNGTGIGTITDDDAPPTISIGSASVAEGDSGSADLTYTVTLSTASGRAITVGYEDEGSGTATSGTDYTAITAGSLTFAEDETTKDLTVAVLGDALDEPDETVLVQLKDPANASLATATGTGTITDDDPTPSLSIDSPTITEGDTGSTDLTFTVTLSAASGREVTVDYEDTGDGTATSATDYDALTAGTLTFSAGETTKEITVTVNGDLDDEPDETVEIELSGAANATLGTATGTGTITDDEATPAVTLALSPTEIPENGGSSTVTATLDVVSSADTTITVAAEAGANTDGSDFTLSSARTLTIAAGATTSTGTVTISAEDDAADEANKIVRVTGTATNSVGVTQPPEVTLTIVDDDGQSGVYLDSPSVTEGDSGQTTLTFTVRVSPASPTPVTVEYADAGAGTATAGADYGAVTAGSLSFAANDTSRTVAVTVVGDTLDEHDETVVLTLSNPTNASLGTATGAGTITDDDDPPTLTLSSPSVNEGDVGSVNLTYTVTLSAVSGRSVTVDYADTGTGTATAGTDYATASGTLTIPAGSLSGTFALAVFGDGRDEANETVVMELRNADGATIATGTGTGTITDDDGQPTLTIDSPSVNEGDSGSTDLTFTVTLSAASEQQVTVNYADPGTGSATSGTDYTAIPSGSLTFAPGETRATITVSVTGDTTEEPNETVRILLSSAQNAAIVSGTGTGTILDDEDSPTVTLFLASPTILENGGSTAVTATLDHASTSAVTITVLATPGTGATTSDYSLSSARTLTIAAGSTTSTGTVTITAVDNATDTANKTVTVSGAVSDLRAFTAPANVTLTIVDDDGDPKITMDSPRVVEGDAGTTNLTFTVRLSPASSQTVTASYGQTGGTATRGTDFNRLTPGNVAFAAFETVKTVSMTVNGDTVDERDETVVVTLSNPQGATLETATGTATILDDDATPSVSLSLSPTRITENGGSNSSTVTATLDRASAEATTITVAAAPGTNAEAADFRLSSNATLSIAAGSTASTGSVTVTAVADTTDEPDQQVTVSATARNSLGVVVPASRTLTITDDDAPPALSLAAGSVSEGDSGSTDLTYTVSLSPASAQQVLVDYSDAGSGTATSGTDYAALTAGTLTFAPGDTSATFTVSVTGDATDEPNETVAARLTNPRNATIAAGTASGTITDDDAAPTVTLVLTPSSIAESGTMNASTVTATLDHPSSEDTTITVSATAGTNAADGDFRVSANKELTIAAGSATSTGTVTITAVDNTTDDAAKSVTVSGAAVNALGVTNPSAVTLTITDDDAAPSLAIDSPSAVTEGDSGTTDITFTVTLDAVSTQQVTVGYADAGTGTATSGDDYAAITSGTLTFAAGDTTGQITVTVNGDTTDEPNETVLVELSNAANATIGTATGTGTITDDDAAPTVTLALSRTSIAESGTTNSTTVTASLNRPSSAVTTITVSAAAGTNAVAGDFSISSNTTLSIAAGATSSTGTVTVSANDNTTDEPNKSVTISGSATNTQGINDPANLTLTITDDDPEPSLSINSLSVTEGDTGTANLVFTVTLNTASGKEVTVNYADAGTGTATSGTDYTALSSGTLTFTAGDTSEQITVTVSGDNLDENDETVLITLSGASNASIATATGTGTITDDEATPAVTLALSPTEIPENGGSSTVTATLDVVSSADTTITVAAEAGANTDGSDFTLSSARTLTIAAGATTSTGTVTISAEDDAADEANKIVRVTGTATNSVGVTQPPEVTLTIVDDDGQSGVYLDSPSVTEGDSGQTTLTFTVRVSPASPTPVTVEYADAGAGTATAGADYGAVTAGSLSFAANDTSRTVAVTVVGDTLDEHDETVVLTLSNPTNASLGTATGAGTITDDDDPPTLTLSSPSVNEGDVGSVNLTYTVTLSAVSGRSVTVDYADTGTGTATAGTDYATASGTLTIPAGSLSGTFALAVFGDGRDEANETVVMELRNADGATIATGTGTGTITDDDGQPTLTIDSPSVNEGDSGSTDLTFTVTLSAASEQQVTVNYADPGTGSATSGTDYTAIPSGSLTFAPGETRATITVSVTGDTTEEPNETVRILLSSAQNAAIVSGTGTGTILDDEDSPTVTLFLASPTILENGGSTAVTATLDHASTSAVTITVLATPGTGATTSDYSLSSARTLTIAAGSTTSTGTVTITAVDNATDTANKTVTVSGAVSDLRAFTAPANVTLTIVDDDGDPKITMDSPRVVEGDAGTTNLTFTVRLSPASSQTVTASYGQTGGTATRGTDFNRLTPGNVAFAAFETVKTVSMTVNGDTVDERDETVVVTLSNPQGATLETATGTATILDDDATPSVSLSLSPTRITENGGSNSSTVTATLDRASAEATTITVAAAPGTNAEAADFRLSSNATLSIAAGSTASTGSVTVTAVADTTDEPDQQVTVSATARNSLGVVVPASRTLTITDDDAPPALSLAAGSVSEGDSGSTDLTYTVSLSPASAQQVLVDYSDAGSGTATSGTDYAALTAGTLTFAPGDTSATFTVSVTGDATDEPNETVAARLTNPRNATIAAGTASGTITDDDAAPTVTLVLTPSSIAESGTMNASTVTATLDHPSSEDTTITVSATAGTNAADGDFRVSANKELTIAAGSATSTGTVTITAVDNTTDDAAKSVTVSGAAVNALGVTNPSAVTLTITDDDAAPSLAIDSPSAVTEGDSGTTDITFTVTLDAVSTQQVTVGYADAGTGTATSGDDYAAITSGTLTFAAGDTTGQITVTVNGDTTDEPNETVLVELSNAANATIGTATGTGTITDDDAAPTVTLALSRTSIAESGTTNSTTVTASLNRPSSAVTTITVSAAAGTNAVAGDFSISSNTTLSIAAGATSSTGTVTVSANDNTTDEPNKSVTISGSATNTQGINDPANLTLTITDDDPEPSLSINSLSVTEGDTGTANLVFTVTLNTASGKEVTVNYADAGTGTATSGTDYTALSSGTLTFTAGDTSEQITVTVSGDNLDENDETVLITLSGASNASIATATGTGTITDDDGPPTVTLALSPTSIAESGATNSSTVTASLGHPSIAVTTITVGAAAGTNAVAGDFRLSSNRTLTIAAGATSSTGTVTITAVDNTRDEDDKSVTVSGTAQNTSGVTDPANRTLTITDDDSPPTLSIGSASVTEGDSGSVNLTFTVSLDTASGKQVTVGYADAGTGTATSGTDYTAITAGTLTFAATDTSETITVSVTGDTLDEPNETVAVALSGATNASISSTAGTGTGTITDDEPSPTVTLALSRTSITESGTNNSATVTASLDHASSVATTITVGAAAGTNAVSGDYSLSSSPTLTIAAGSTNSTGTVTITAVDNTRDEDDKRVTVSGSATNSLGITNPSNLTLTITDDDGPPSLSISSPSVAEGDSGTANLTFTVSLSTASDKQVTVDYAEGSTGTATAGTDYTALPSGTLTFSAGDTSEQFTVTVTGDETDEPNETVVVALSNPANATIGAMSGTGTGTITDDDPAPTVTLALSPTSIAESGATSSSTVTASLDRPSSAATTITVSATAGTNAEAGDFSLSSTPTLTIAAGATSSTGTVTVTAQDNATDEPDKSVTVSGSATNSQGITQPAAVTLTITDDDAEPVLSINSPSAVSEGDTGSTNLTFTVSLSAASGKQVTVAYGDEGSGTADSGTDYAAITTTTLTFAAGDTSRTFTVSITGDETDEPNETVLVELTNAANATVSSSAGTGTGTITDDDDAPTVTLALSPTSIAESGTTNTSTITASLDHPSSEDTTVTVAAAAGTNAVAGDFSLSNNKELTISAGGTTSTGTVTIAAVDNTTDEPDKSVTVSGSATNSQGITAPSNETLTITDDDAAASLAIADPSDVTEGDSGATNMTFTVTLSPASGKEVTVDFADGGSGTATSGTDYTAITAGTLTFAVGDTSETITVSVTGDDTDEPDETVEVELSNAGNGSIGTAAATGTITDDDAAPKVTLALSPTSIAESGTTNTSTVTASLDRPSSEDTTITVSAAAGTNAVAADFSRSANADLTVSAGATSSAGTVTITANDNTTDEDDKSVTVSGSATNSQGITDPDAVTLTITDDDAPPSLAISSPSVAEGASGSTDLTFTVTLSAASDKQVEVEYTEGTGGTATAGTDYTAPSDGTLTFLAGDTSETITVSVTGDTTDEVDETIVLSLRNPTNATIGTGTGTGTITDDDGEPSLAVDSPMVAEGNAGTTNLTYTVTLTPASGKQVTVAYADEGSGTAASGTDYDAITGGTLTFAAGATTRTFTVRVRGDRSDEPDETVVAEISGARNASIGTATGTGTITDDDGEPSLTIDSPSAAEGTGTPGTLTFTVSVNPVSGKEVTVGYSDAGTGTATAGTDYTAPAAGTLTFAPGTRSLPIAVALLADGAIEPAETVVLELASPTNATIGTGTGTGTITDDDTPTPSGGGGSTEPSRLSIDSPTVTESDEGVVSLIYTVSLNPAASSRVTVSYSVTSGTASAGADFAVLQAGELVFRAGETSKTIEITVLADDAAEEDETIVVQLSNARGAEIETATGVGTIRDDDRPTDSDPRFLSSVSARTWREDTPIRPLLLPEALGGTAPLTYALSPDLPPGLTLDRARRTISGTPTGPFATREYRWTVTDADDRSATTSFTITVTPDLKPSFRVSAGPELRYRVGRAVPPETLPEAAGGDGALTYAVTPALPPGLAFAPATRVLSGTPTDARERTAYTLTATDEDGDAASVRFAIAVRSATTLETLRLTSRPANGDTYFHGESIELEAVFSDPVPVPGSATLALTVGGRTRPAALSGANGAALRFRYTVVATDRDTDGVSVAANALTLGAVPGAGEPRAGEIDASHAPLPDQPGHRVDGAPQAVGTLPAITLTLGAEPARVEIGDAFHAAVRYAAQSSAPEVAVVALDADGEAAVLVTAVAEGGATVTVTGTNAGGSAEQRFEVTVVTARAEREVVEHAFAGLGRSLLTSASATVGRRLLSGGGGAARSRDADAADTPEGDEAEGHEVTFTGLPTDDRLRLEEALRTARSFTLSARRAGGPRWTVWANGDLQSFSGESPSGEANTFTGRPLSSWLGVDVAGGGVLAGLSVSRTTGDADYTFADLDTEVAGTGRLEARLFQVHPYFRWQPGAGTTLWGHGGLGRGTATLTRSVTSAAEEADLNLMVGLAGLRQSLGTAGGTSLALRADLGGARLEAGEGALLRDLAATVYRGRLGLEVSARFGPATPFLELGGRYDGGAGPTGAGLEVAGGLRVNDERGRLGLEARGRVLALHTAAGYREQGVSLTARFTPKGADRGLMMEVRPTWGAPANGAQTLWQDSGGGLDELGGAAVGTGGGMAARVSYGLGLLTPFTEVTWTDALSRMIRAGLRVGRYGQAIDLEMAGGRQARPDGGADYRLDLYGRLRLP